MSINDESARILRKFIVDGQELTDYDRKHLRTNFEDIEYCLSSDIKALQTELLNAENEISNLQKVIDEDDD